MNLDKAIETIETGFQQPETIIRRTPIPADELTNYGLRRKGTEDTQWVWTVTVGERGQNPVAWFLHHKLTSAMKLALVWRGVAPIKRPRKNGKQAKAQST
jgi:hypothetical protein